MKDQPEPKQLQHHTPLPGAPCTRCGLRYSPETSYVPCFREGDTFESWLKRQNDAIRALVTGKHQVPS